LLPNSRNVSNSFYRNEGNGGRRGAHDLHDLSDGRVVTMEDGHTEKKSYKVLIVKNLSQSIKDMKVIKISNFMVRV